MSPLLTVDDYLAAPAVPADVRVPYGPLPDQFADLYLPAGAGPHPVIVLIHGGCWRDRFDLAPLGPFAAALRDAGYAVYSLEYRRLGASGGWPMTFVDVGMGADALRNVAAQYSLDPDRVVAMGHSAGGHLALWLAARPGLPAGSSVAGAEPLRLRAVVGLAALGDLAAAAEQELCGGAVPELVGGVSERYAEASPAARFPLGTPHIHLVGSADPIVPAPYVAAFVAAAQAAGDTAVLTTIADAGHFELTTPASNAWPAVLAALEWAFEADHKADAVLAELTTAADGLLVMSETDAPLTAYTWPGADLPALEDLPPALNMPPDTLVTTLSVPDFFAPQAAVYEWHEPAERERAARFAALRDLILARLETPLVYRVGAIEITVLVLGRVADAVIGLRTLVVET